MRVQFYGINDKVIAKAVDVLSKGGLIIYPTDTVYALGCASNHVQALAKLATLKNAKKTKPPVSLVCSSISHATGYTGQIDNATFRLLKSHLPGPFTFILPVTQKIPKALGKRSSIGVRVPDHSGVQALIQALGQPLASASLHDEDEIRDYITDPDEIEQIWGKVVNLFLDSGFGGNQPSSVIDLCEATPQILREGAGTFQG
jgi:tRNA threonylcarbamoyl adenosine modification protein (Sua5/YciO/YrdC/YwlC family)